MDQNKDFLKSNCKIRRKAEIKSKFTKVDSPLAKYDSSGNLTCILCRIPIKANVWKVHLNSKQHKQFVELAKQQRVEAGRIKEISQPKQCDKAPQKVPPAPSERLPTIDAVKLPIVNSEQASQVQVNSGNILPDKFFDKEKSTNTVVSDRDPDAEWTKFQREIREAATISNIIVAEEQDNLNIKRHIKEIDEQMENWKRFIKISDKKNILVKRERKGKIAIDLDADSSSDEERSIDELSDWRIKSVHK